MASSITVKSKLKDDGVDLVCIQSISGYVKLLNDPDPLVREQVLRALIDCVDRNWPELSDYFIEIENLACDEKFSHRKEAAFILSKLAYYLNLTDEIFKYAIIADDLFFKQHESEYTLTVIGRGIAKYCRHRQEVFDIALTNNVSPERLKDILCQPSNKLKSSEESLEFPSIDESVEYLLLRLVCENLSRGIHGHWEGFGICIECKRLDLISAVIANSTDLNPLFEYLLEQARKIKSRSYRLAFYYFLAELYDTYFPMDKFENLRDHYTEYLEIFYHMQNVNKIARLMHNLLFCDSVQDEEKEIAEGLAYQCAFDFIAYEDSVLQRQLLEHELLQLPNQLSTTEAPSEVNYQMIEPSGSLSPTSLGCQNQIQASPLKATDCENDTSEPMENEPLLGDSSSQAERGTEHPASSDPCDETLHRSNSLAVTESNETIKIKKLHKILSGLPTLEYIVEFLHTCCVSEVMVLDDLGSMPGSRNAVIPNAVAICHTFMLMGTTCSEFLRFNLEWIGRAICWAKFLVSASIGPLHKGHLSVSRQVLGAYLPGCGGDAYNCGGGIFGLGIIHANHFDPELKAYLLEQLQTAQTQFPQNFEPLQHGVCLALGLLAMRTQDQEINNALRDIIFMDSAVSGEAAAIGLGMVYLGSGSSAIVKELLGHAQDTEHERITRGAALGAALVLYRKEQEAEPMIRLFTRHSEPMIRYGGMFAIGLAYCGTSSASAIRQLLHIGLTDISDHVRRAAVIALGFVACNEPKVLLSVVSLLVDSFNPHVRHGAALAIGLGCCGSNLNTAKSLLLSMKRDTWDVVRQASLLAGGLVVSHDNDMIDLPHSDKNDDSFTRFGMIIAYGLLKAGGQNCTISFYTAQKTLRDEAVVGLLLFSQLWFWHPFILAACLAFRPMGLIGLTNDLTIADDFYLRMPGAGKVDANNTKAETTGITNQKSDVNEVPKEHAAETFWAEYLMDMRNKPDSSDEEAQHSESKAKVWDRGLSRRKKRMRDPTANDDVYLNLCPVSPSEEKLVTYDVPYSEMIPIDMRRRSGILMLRKNPNFDPNAKATLVTEKKQESEQAATIDNSATLAVEPKITPTIIATPI